MSDVWKIVEFGCGNLPAPLTGNLELSSTRQYVGLDLSRIALSAITGPPGKLEHASFTLGDAQHTPFEDESVDEILMADFVGDKRIDLSYLNQRRKIRLRESYGVTDRLPPSELPEDFPTIIASLKEANRILKKNGKLTILETQTPPTSDFLAAWFKATGFKSVEGGYITARNPKWEERVAPYRMEAPRQSQIYIPPFMAIASKIAITK